MLAVHAVSLAPARRSALEALGRIRRDEAFSGAVLSAELSRGRLSSEDASLATRLTYGVLAAEGVLDEAIDRHLKGSLEPRVRDALRLAAFEMLFGRAPVYAVVDQGVEAARHARPQAARLANAVLRRLGDEAASFPWGDPGRDRDALARQSGTPRWIVDLVLADLGETHGRELLACAMEPAPTYVRLEPFGDRTAALASLRDASPVQSPPDEDCYRLDAPARAFSRGEHVGWFAMDAAAQLAPAACAPRAGMRVLDVGAGRGNKTVCLQGIATRSGGPAEIIAVDSHAGKGAALERRLAESGVKGVAAVTGDGTDLAGLLGEARFDVVLVDAPCSGLGTMRRYPEKRWRLDPSTPARMAELQSRMLRSAAEVVGAGGAVVYSTCSVAREENDEVVDGFLATEEGRSFRLEPLTDAVPAEWIEFTTGRGCFQSWPTSGGPDGHYVAVLRAVRGTGS